jgi:hypothetical protein
MTAWINFSSTPDATAVIAEAVRLYGRSRGWHLAAQLLGVSERTVRGISYGETSGASIPLHTALEARATLRRQRAAQLRAELRALETALADDAADQAGAPMGLGR